ncbi:helix-turn-helix transcriptional regulator [Candidatus Peregrinibacteria bacterium]|nr:helix-turn-helix transcriptional regulator [Candidatus Peregrinibacteria bacterium]
MNSDNEVKTTLSAQEFVRVFCALDMKKQGEVLRQLRKLSKETQKEVGAALGISGSMISNLEKGLGYKGGWKGEAVLRIFRHFKNVSTILPLIVESKDEDAPAEMKKIEDLLWEVGRKYPQSRSVISRLLETTQELRAIFMKDIPQTLGENKK